MSDATIILKMLRDRLYTEQTNQDLQKRVHVAVDSRKRAEARLESAQKTFDDPEIETDGTHLERCQEELKHAKIQEIQTAAAYQGYKEGLKRAQEVVSQLVRYGE